MLSLTEILEYTLMREGQFLIPISAFKYDKAKLETMFYSVVREAEKYVPRVEDEFAFVDRHDTYNILILSGTGPMEDYASAEDAPIVDYHMNFIRNRKKVPAATNAALTVNDPNHDPNGPRQCYAEAMRLKSFHPADDEHQGYLKRHPELSTHIDFALLEELEIIK